MAEPFEAQKCIDAILKVTLAPLLKVRGYKKTGHTWRKFEDPLTKVANVQLSSGNSVAEARFTVNLGIYHEEFHRHRSTPVAGDIKEYHCDVRVRIGELMEERNDHWWTVGRDKDNEKVKADLACDFEKYALPWLETFHGSPEMLDHFLHHSMFFDAAIAEHLLKGPRVLEFLKNAHSKANPVFQRTLERWAKMNGYDLKV